MIFEKNTNYIIIGSGPAAIGCIIGILENDPLASIICIERGKHYDDYPEFDVVGNPYYYHDTLIENEVKMSLSEENKKIHEPNVFGGGLHFDNLEVSLGDESDFKDWGNTYNYENIQKYFEYFRQYLNINEIHKTNLSNSIKKNCYKYRICDSIEENDFNALEMNDEREHIHINNILKNKKFEYVKFYVSIEAIEILFNKNKAIGVIANNLLNNKKITFKCDTKVIVACGTLAAVRLLINSGIGPKNELINTNKRILIINDNVGKNIDNTPIMIQMYKPNSEIKLVDEKIDIEMNPIHNLMKTLFVNNHFLTFLIGLISGIVFNLLYTKYITTQQINFQWFAFIFCGIFDGLFVGGLGISLTWTLSYHIGIFTSLMVLIFYDIRGSVTIYLSISYWISYVIAIISIIIIGSVYHRSISEASTIILTLETKKYKQYIYTLRDYLYYITRTMIDNGHIKLVLLNFGIAFMFLRYLLFSSYILIKTVLKKTGRVKSNYTFKNNKWVLNIDLIKDRICIETATTAFEKSFSLMYGQYSYFLYPRIQNLTHEEKKVVISKYIHPSEQVVGSCIMGNSEKDSVVDKDTLNVHGIDNLSIVGSPTFRNIVTGNSVLICLIVGYIHGKNIK